ncbi:MAG: phosphomannomutase/phosphoglucomutase [Spirochaetia bacterium]
MGIFKAYDIRGIFGSELTPELTYKIGYCLIDLLDIDTVVVGRDARISSDILAEQLFAGITDAGAHVVNLGQTTTPALYYYAGITNAKASVQITASHNPKDYNGMKISKENLISLGGDTGDIQRLEILVNQLQLPVTSQKKGTITTKDIEDEYIEYLSRYLVNLTGLKIGIDMSNGMAALYIPKLLEKCGAQIYYICQEIDGRFPCHEPNPLIEENCTKIKNLVKEKQLDLGLIFDGDADRVMLVDEKAQFIRPDLTIAIIASLLVKTPDVNVVVDIRSSRSVSEYLQQLGANPVMWRVGHAYAIQKVAEVAAIFGGELAGHYYFRDFFHCDSGIIAALLVLQHQAQLKKEGQKLSHFIAKIDTYANSGELNFIIDDKATAIQKVIEFTQSLEPPQQLLDFDGYRFDYKDWWFNIRPSNTEPYLRLIVEAKNETILKTMVEKIISILTPYISEEKRGP